MGNEGRLKMRLAALLLLCSTACGVFRTSYRDVIRGSPKLSAADLINQATVNPIATEAQWGGKNVQVFGIASAMRVDDHAIGRSSGLRSCADESCAGNTRRPHMARIATALVIDSNGKQQGAIACIFQEGGIDNAARVRVGEKIVIGGMFSSISTDNGTLVKITNCTVP
jgi:hypothetical protein